VERAKIVARWEEGRKWHKLVAMQCTLQTVVPTVEAQALLVAIKNTGGGGFAVDLGIIRHVPAEIAGLRKLVCTSMPS